MNWYRENCKEWKSLIEAVAREMGKSEQMVEKDTIQSMFLFELANSDLPFVFKGGTSLSKAYQLTDRFSEDIDLSMNRKPTQAQRKKTKMLIVKTADTLGLTLYNAEEIKSRHDYNKYVFKYDSFYTSIPSEIVIETSFYQNAYPVEYHPIYSFVGQFCKKNNLALPVPFEANEMVMQVQSAERTLIDKVFAVCDYKIQNNQRRNSRHLYDICKLMERVKLDDKLRILVARVRNDRMTLKNNASAQTEYSIPDILEDIIQSRFYETDYKSITLKLLYENVPYDEAIKNGIAVIAQSDVFSV